MYWRPFFKHFTQSALRMSDHCSGLNDTWTFGILILCSLLTFWLHTIHDPVSCWAPAEFLEQMVLYTNKACWESNQFDIPPEDLATDTMVRKRKTYYRWIPLILLIQALLFKIPGIVLSVGQGMVGFRFTKILGLTNGYHYLNMADRSLMGKQIGRYMRNWIDSTVMKGCPWGLLTLLFLFTKLLYFVNIITQLSVMDSFLKSDNQSSFGNQLVNDFSSNETLAWRFDDPPFPRVFACSFSVRIYMNYHTYSVQCLLNNATFYEMMFGFVWIWLLFVSVITTLSGLLQLILVFVPIFRKRYIKSYLHLSLEVTPTPSDLDISKFAGSEISEDGILILKAIGEASSEHLVRDIIIYLWHLTHPQAQMPTSSRSRMYSHGIHQPDMPPGEGMQPGVYQHEHDYTQGNTVMTSPFDGYHEGQNWRRRPGSSGNKIPPESFPLMETA